MLDKARKIWKLLEGQRLRYAGATAALIVASCFLYLAPLVPQITIDGVIARDPERASPFVKRMVELLGGQSFVADNLWLPCVLILGITGIAGLFTYFRGRLSAKACETIIRDVRDRVYDQLQHLSCSYFDKTETGDLIQRCTSDVDTMRNFLSMQIVEIGRAMVMLLVPIPLMLAIDVPMTIVSVLLIPIVSGFSFVFFIKVKHAFKESDEAEGAMTTVVQENLTGIRVVRAFARQEYECEKFEQKADAHRRLDYRLYYILAWFWSSSDLLCFTQRGLVVGAGAYWLATGRLQVGEYFYFITAVNMFIWPVRMMGRILTDLGKALVAFDRLNEILDAPRETMPTPDETPEVIQGEIEFANVTFSHVTSKEPVLHDISFRVEQGKTLALVGQSGSGKSTIVNLLLRFYDYQHGSIRLDGRELKHIDRQFIRSQSSVVMQEPFLYSKTLRENLVIGRPAAGEDEMMEATAVAAVHESIIDFDDGYDTMVGERGVMLSGGQRQRVALARALLADPAVLILDDALSAVDAETEDMILTALRTRRGRHTTIVIAHRLSTLLHADEILVLHHGRVVQRGTHGQLLGQKGLYRRLWHIQTSSSAASDDAIVPGTTTSQAAENAPA
ncbi:MAG: ABC transporter ATP-binding protein [Planctomycetes bacterium]|nr:ABC transporter ATP-binding protein [Planctomycetota bacterium]NOG55182.1 ABC transporter ATP-binding protein [Planctomycetota bacterium]